MAGKHRGGPGPAARKRAARMGDILTLVAPAPPRPLTAAQKRRQRIDELEAKVKEQQTIIENERLRRVSAQRGLVNYMREHGLGDRIGYDPDADPEVIAAIEAGTLPAKSRA